jgi:protein-tyrosine phosphatase
MIVAIDFDGTIVEDRFPEIGDLRPNAKWAINSLRDEGYYTILWTSRSGIDLLRAVEFLTKEGIRFDAINESNPDNLAQYGKDTRKIFANIYIDDKTIYELPDWKEIYDMIHAKIPTYADKVIIEGYL